MQPVNSLARTKTTLNAPNARERIEDDVARVGASQSALPRGDDVPAATSISRNNSALAAGRPGQANFPKRGLSVRRPSTEDAPPPTSSKSIVNHFPFSILSYPLARFTEGASRATDFYDNLVDSYAQRSPTLPVPGNNNDRIANWARGNTGGPTRTPSASAFGGSRSGTLKRRVTRRTIAPSVYDDEEEGYGSGEWDEMYELTKIRVKIHFDGDVRGMTLDPEIPFTEFRKRVADKFETSPQAITLKFRDEDGGKVSLHDASDYDLAIETARESAKGKPEGKLEVWCERK